MFEIKAKGNETLEQHTENALKIFSHLKKRYSEIPSLCGVPDFFEHLFYCLFLHDFGKAATGFQKIFSALGTGYRWKYRHEILSAGFVGYLNYPSKVKEAIALAIMTHHKDMDRIRTLYASDPPSSPGFLEFCDKSSELAPHIDGLGELMRTRISDFSRRYYGCELDNFSLPQTDHLENARSGEFSFLDAYHYYGKKYLAGLDDVKSSRARHGAFYGNSLYSKYGIFLRGFTIACDHLSSAGETTVLDLPRKIPWVENLVLNEIQQRSRATKGNAMLIAPTGYGKTESALLWAWNNQDSNGSKRVFYMLPYIASINAMYQRFEEGFSTESLIGLLHSKNNAFLYDLYKKREIFDEDLDSLLFDVRKKTNLCKKIYLPLKILTPFQLLKAFFQVRGFEQILSELAGSLIIVDEIHAYDARTTSLMMCMLQALVKHFSARVFLMSATVPGFLKQEIESSVGVSPNNEIRVSKTALKAMKRHEIRLLGGTLLDNLDLVSVFIEKGKKVLIACNTVNTAQQAYESIKTEALRPVLLHSRFSGRDRNQKELQLGNCDVLVGTQAIEVSLDVSFDVLFSEPAPIDALIQRAGRVNRLGHGNATGSPAPIHVFRKGSAYDSFIYPEAITEKTIKALEKVSVLSEARIQELMDDVYGEGYGPEDQDTHDEVSGAFGRLISSIVPFVSDKGAEESFYRLFRSFEVVPLCFKDRVKKCLEDRNFLDLMSLYVSISDRNYYRLKKKGTIVEFEELDDVKFVDAPYDPEFGLRL